jgi:hypothetical protein
MCGQGGTTIAGQLLPFLPIRAMQEFASRGSDPRRLHPNLARPGRIVTTRLRIAARLLFRDTRGYNLPFRGISRPLDQYSNLLLKDIQPRISRIYTDKKTRNTSAV